MNRPPAFPPSGRRQRPPEVDTELRRYARRSGDDSVASEELTPAPPADHVPAGARRPESGAVAEQNTAPIPAQDSAVSMRLRERLAELRGARRRARWRTIAIVGGAMGLVAIGLWIIAFSPFFAFAVEELEVSGTSDYISRGDVAEVMAPHEGTPLLRLDTDAITAELEQKYAVRAVEFERVWPTGVHVTLTPRVAVAATPGDEGFFIIDGEGVELAHVTEPAPGLPIIELTRDEDGLAETIIAVLHVMDALPPNLLEQVADVGARTARDVRFTLTNGAEVIWGSAQESDLKASVLEILLQTPASVYNVTTPMTPITS